MFVTGTMAYVSAPLWLAFLTLGTALWILIAYKFHQSMIDAVTGGREVTRQEEPRLYNLLENLCISRGITMPTLRSAPATEEAFRRAADEELAGAQPLAGNRFKVSLLRNTLTLVLRELAQGETR